MYHSLVVLAIDFVTYDGLSTVLVKIQLIVALTMYHSLMVLAMDFVCHDGLSIVSQDTINRSAS